MLWYKLWEQKQNSVFKLSAKISEADHFVLDKAHILKSWIIVQKDKLVHFITNHVPHHSQKISAKVKEVVDKKFIEVKDVVRGKYAPKVKGEVSAFLQKLSSKSDDEHEQGEPDEHDDEEISSL